jgi:hypothetical protein
MDTSHERANQTRPDQREQTRRVTANIVDNVFEPTDRKEGGDYVRARRDFFTRDLE